MKNFFKFLGIIALAAVIGFSMVSCDNGNPDPGPGGGGGGGGGGSAKWRSELVPINEGTYGKWSQTGGAYLTFMQTTSSSTGVYSIDGNDNTKRNFDLVSCENKDAGVAGSSFKGSFRNLYGDATISYEATITYTLAADKKSFTITGNSGWDTANLGAAPTGQFTLQE